MRLERLAKQLQAHERSERKAQRHLATRLRAQIADANRKIRIQVQALEGGVEPEVVTERITELKADRAAAEGALQEIGPEEEQAEDEDLAERLKHLPDLSKQLRKAPRAVKRQMFEAFDLRITYEKVERRIEISATVSEAVAEA